MSELVFIGWYYVFLWLSSRVLRIYIKMNIICKIMYTMIHPVAGWFGSWLGSCNIIRFIYLFFSPYGKMNGKDTSETNAADGWALVYYYYYKQQIAFSSPYSHELCFASAMQVLLSE